MKMMLKLHCRAIKKQTGSKFINGIRYFFERILYHKSGEIALTGTPVIDSIRQQILFPDLNYSLSTKSRLLKVANWIYKTQLKDELRQSAVIPLGDKLTTLKDVLTSHLNIDIAPKIKMSGDVDSISIRNLTVSSNSIEIVLKAHGQINLEIQ
jgi:hypothetical protein